MKKIVLTCSVICLFLTAHAQRAIDLSVSFTNVQNGDSFVADSPFTLSLKVENLGPSTLENTDTLYYYVIINGDTSLTAPNLNYHPYSTYTASSGDYFVINRTLILTSTMAGSDYDYCVFVKPKNGGNPITDSDLSNNMTCATISVTENNLSISEVKLIESTVYPNPAIHHFTVKNWKSGDLIQVFDAQGKELSINQTSAIIPCADWKKGVYYVRHSDGYNIQTQKLLLVD